MDWSELISIYNGESSDAKDKHLRFVFYGAPGSGKTTLAATFPNCFFIDTDRGMTSLRGKQIPSIQLSADRSFQQVYDILTAASKKQGAFSPEGRLADRETIVIDGISALADDYLLPQILREAGKSPINDKATFDEYGKLKQRLIAISNLIKDVSQQYHVIVTALVDEEKNEVTGDLRGKPLMTGKYRDKIGGDYDEEYYLESVKTPSGQQYVLHLASYRWFEAKTRNMKVTALENPTFEKLWASLK